MKRTLLLGIAALLFSSCAQYISEVNGHFDARNKTMSVPPGMDGAKTEIKSELRRHGWTLYASGMGSTMEQYGSTSRFYSDTTAKYTMLLNSKMTQDDLVLGKEYTYNLSIIENRSGLEIMTAQGNHSTPRQFAEKLMSDISANTY
jgi:hypothetical protein